MATSALDDPEAVLAGPGGWAQRCPIPHDHPNHEFAVDTWFLELPSQGLGWHHYLLSVVSLQTVEGKRAPVLRYPQAEYEVIVMALDPRRRPKPGDWRTWYQMEPLNFVEQFHGITREQARMLAALLAQACANLRLLAETQMYVDMFDGSKPKMMTIKEVDDAWRETIRQTVEHMTSGGRACGHR